MNIRQLRYFVSVAQHLSFTEAARHLYISQPSLSEQIIELEKSLGVRLLIRTTRSVKLTSAGEVLLKEAQSFLAKADELVEKTQRANAGFTGTLKIGFLGAPTKKYLPQLINQFRRNYPNIDVNLVQFTSAPLQEALEHGSLDIGFTRPFEVPHPAGLVWRYVYIEPLTVVMRYDHPLAPQTKLNFAAIAREPFVMLSREEATYSFDLMMQVCANRKFIPTIVKQTRGMEAVLLEIEAGTGISIVPRSVVQAYASPFLHHTDIEGEDARTSLVVAWKSEGHNHSVPLLLQELENYNWLATTGDS